MRAIEADGLGSGRAFYVWFLDIQEWVKSGYGLLNARTNVRKSG